MLLRGGARSADPDVPLGQTVRDILTSVGWSPQPPAARGAARERWDAMQALVGLADDMVEARGGATLADLVAELDDRASAQHAPTVDGVTLASLHAAKGLEWDAVFLAGLSDGLLPISLAQTEAAVSEERRLLYVGVTRARRHLELSYAAARTPGSRANRTRSRFLAGLWPGEEKDRGAGRRTSAAADPEVLDRLRRWRDRVADERGVPAFRVLPDVALEAVAAAMPTAQEDLRHVRGLGQTRLHEYGDALLRVVAGDSPAGPGGAVRTKFR